MFVSIPIIPQLCVSREGENKLGADIQCVVHCSITMRQLPMELPLLCQPGQGIDCMPSLYSRHHG